MRFITPFKPSCASTDENSSRLVMIKLTPSTVTSTILYVPGVPLTRNSTAIGARHGRIPRAAQTISGNLTAFFQSSASSRRRSATIAPPSFKDRQHSRQHGGDPDDSQDQGGDCGHGPGTGISTRQIREAWR